MPSTFFFSTPSFQMDQIDFLAAALGSIPALIWGDRAVGFLGVRTIWEHYVLVIDDTHFQRAVQQLRNAEFRDCPWSFGSLHPEFYTGKIKERVYRTIVNDYGNLDRHSARFLFPTEEQSRMKVVLLPTSYTHLEVAHPSNEALHPGSCIYYPSAARLLQSFVQTLVREPVRGMWTSTLTVWSISYLYGELELGLDESVLDMCGDDEAKDWFNEKILRFAGVQIVVNILKHVLLY
ncbi:hypothetical protein A9K55_003733 [Cordyceps militaris]|uniref:Uncharacterized protein n=1 Tax=Cordyceps militaris TaxID=73501 RepID=A0A2H4S914_CORMI|nr:hypothetical protein A9K55_003733 [Cordyceps militaris]